MLSDSIRKLVDRHGLTRDEMAQAMEEIMSGTADPTLISAFLVSLRMKGETVDEITAAAEVMRAHSVKIRPSSKRVLDTCGTGGDSSGTFNISTAAAFVAAGAGVAVAKHGNRSVSSKCGSADILQELGVNIEMDIEKAGKAIEEVGIAFFFAPKFHPAMKFAAPVRRALGIRTIFNILGPLSNPARAQYQLLGVYNKALVRPLAEVLKNLGVVHAMVVSGGDGLDEVTITQDTAVAELKDGRVSEYFISPSDYGFKPASREMLLGGDAASNARIFMDVISGKRGPQRDVVVLNAGCAIYTADKAGDIKEGIALAMESIDSGAALKKLEALRSFA